MDIIVKSGDPVVAHAAAELGRCVRAMAGREATSGTVTLGLFADCGIEAPPLPDAATMNSARQVARRMTVRNAASRGIDASGNCDRSPQAASSVIL